MCGHHTLALFGISDHIMQECRSLDRCARVVCAGTESQSDIV